MNLTAQLTALREETRGLTRDDRAKRCCDLAKQLEKSGEYEAACEALSEFWPEPDGGVSLDDLDEVTSAEVLLRVGALAGWLGSTDQAAGSQETAKNLITQSIERFQRLGSSERVAEARGDLALCYWREGAYEEARITLTDALLCLNEKDSELRALLLIRAGIIEERTQQLHEAMRFYNQAAPLLDRSEDHALKGTFHNEFGLVFRRLAAPENREDYLDRALMEYTAASFHFELAGNTRFLARVENNLGYLFFTLGKYDRAHQHLDRARHFFLALEDKGAAAQVDDTRARTFLAEGRVAEAERVARYAVHTLDRGDEQALLAEALTTYGVALARLANYSMAKSLLQRAIKIAETTGDLEGAGRGKLSIIEELSSQTPDAELSATLLSAAKLLRNSQDPGTKNRLISCAIKMVESLSAEPPEVEAARVISWEGLAIKKAVHKTERAIIERALKEAGGSVSKAAHLLGFKHHQSLISIINLRHRDLLTMRSAIRKRRIPLSFRPRRGRPRVGTAAKGTRMIRILLVEHNEKVARVLREMFSVEEWQVEVCMNRTDALKKVAGRKQYDVLLFDNDLPGLNGLELVLRARSLPRRRRTPIIMLSSEDVEAEAWGAGVKAFLRKPADVHKVPETIARLLRIKLKAKETSGGIVPHILRRELV